MSTTGTTHHGTPDAAGTSAATRVAPKPSRRRHTPGGAGLGQDASAVAQRLAAAVLEVLAGVRTPQQAAEALGVSLPRYFQVETRALQALVASCAPRPRGPGRNLERQLTALQRQHEQLQRQLSRQQTLVRLAQRHLGLAPPPTAARAPDGKDKAKKRQRKPVVRALRAAEVLQRRSQEPKSPEAAPLEAVEAAGPPPKHVDS
jgi:hypothetical protein